MLSWVIFSGLGGTCIHATSKWNPGATHGDLGFLLSLWLPPLPSSLFSLIVASACLGSLLPTLGLCPLCPGGHFPTYAFCLYHPLFERWHPIFRTSPIAPPGPALAPASPTSALGTASVSSSVSVCCWENPLRAPTMPMAPPLTPKAKLLPHSLPLGQHLMQCIGACGSFGWRHLMSSEPLVHIPWCLPKPDGWLCSAPTHHLQKKASSWLLSNQEEEDEERWPWL